MVRNTKGSSLIIALIIMSFIMVLAVSLVDVTHSEELMTKSFEGSVSAYYMAETGLERVINTIRYVKPLETVLESIEDPAKMKIDNAINDYFYKNSVNYNYLYPYLIFASREDRNNFESASDGVKCYYEITIDASKVSSLDSNGLYKKSIIISSTGYYDKSVRNILVEYTVNGVLKQGILPYSDDYLNYFCRNNINNIIEPDMDSADIAGGSTIFIYNGINCTAWDKTN